MGPLHLGWEQLLAAGVLVLCSMAMVRAFRVGVELDFAWGAARTVGQLLLVGYWLRWIFDTRVVWLVLAAFTIMLGAAAWTASRRTQKRIPHLLGVAGIALAVGAGVTTFAVTAVVVQADPWWEPRYFLPLSGMIVGNAMNAAALAAERLQSEMTQRRSEIEEVLALGATPRQACDPAMRAAIRASLVPTINSMLTVGLVSLPGMMTGQMVAGADPGIAARYQIVVMFMLTSATTISSILLASMMYRRFFTSRWQLRPDVLLDE